MGLLEAKYQLAIHSRVNTVTGEGFGKEQSYAKIRQELKDTTPNNADTGCMILREGQRDGMISVDYGYLLDNEIITDSIRVEADLKSVVNLSLSELFISKLRVLHPGHGEGLYGRAYYTSSDRGENLRMEEVKLNSSFEVSTQSQIFMMRPSMTFFSASIPPSSFVLAKEVSAVSEREVKGGEELGGFRSKIRP